jgi:5-formyltetrahydrofolate cyclo-ligase
MDLVRGEKQRIRRAMLAARRRLPEAERFARSVRIWERLAGLPCYQRARVILWYLAFDNEVLTAGLIQQAFVAGKRAVVPLVQVDRRRLALCEIRDAERDVAPGYRGIPEPRAGCWRPMPAEALDLAIVPGVAFDVQGGRLGFGAGFYDRLLAELPHELPKLGMAFDFQVLPELPRQPYDMAVNGIVTETRVIWCGRVPGEDGATAGVQSAGGECGRGER